MTPCGVTGAVCPVESGDPAPSSTPKPPAVPHLVAHKVTVLALPFGLNDTTGWQTQVAFLVQNPSRTATYGANYKVAVYAGSKQLAITDGSDTISLWGGEDKPATVSVDDIEGVKPDRATVTFYQAHISNEPLARKWTISKTWFDCSTGTTGCDSTGDLTYGGTGTASISDSVFLLLASDGTIKGAGSLTPSGDDPTARPNSPVPVSGSVYCPDCESGSVKIDDLEVAGTVNADIE
jgi:hypothetical protein